jgi:hypothetical protein
LVHTNFANVQHLRIAKDCQAYANPPGLLEALIHSSAAEATDQRDKVFALLGICSDAAAFTATPSYHWSGPHMCVELTRNVIHSKNIIDIIFTASHQTALSSSLPSWVPDLLHFGTNHQQRLVASYISTSHTTTAEWQPLWKTTRRGGFPRNRPVLSENTITLRGYWLGSIRTLGTSVYDADTDSGFPNRNLPSFKGLQSEACICRAMTIYYRGKLRPCVCHVVQRSLDDEFFTDSVGYHYRARLKFPLVSKWRDAHRIPNLGGRCARKGARQNASSKATAGRWTGPLAPLSSFVSGVVRMVDHIAESPYETPKIASEGLLLFEAVEQVISEGMLLTQLSGLQIGWSHPASRVGDSVWLLEGCTMPGVLRKSARGPKGTFQLVGHAYVVGEMEGQTWSKLRPQDLGQVVIV